MRGKPKGIRRKQAKHETELVDKLNTSIYGDLADFAETQKYEDVHYMRWLEQYRRDTGKYPNRLRADKVETMMIEMTDWASQTFADAILANDVNFFERMAQIARWYRSGQPS